MNSHHSFLEKLPSTKKMISLVVPVLNEEKNIERLYSTVIDTIRPLEDKYNFEFLFTDNHSTDQSYALLQKLAAVDDRIRVLRFSRNFGYQRSILTGYLNAAGDAVIQLDCDLQDPPHLIAEFVEKWEEGNKVVYGVRRRRQEGAAITLARKVFYRGINWLSEHPLPVDAGDFRLVDRCIIEQLRQMDDANPYLRGIIATLGFQQIGIIYDRDPRKFGETKFSFRELMRLALDGVANHSTVPLRLATHLSLAILLVTMLVIAGFTVGRLTIGTEWPAGFTTIAVLILLSTSLNALLFGIQGEYIGRIYRQVQKQPLTIIESQIDNRYSAPEPEQKLRAG